jgi:hypothetical protein
MKTDHVEVSKGVLLYPSNSESKLRLDIRLAGHRIRVWTVDVSKPWQDIRHQLL